MPPEKLGIEPVKCLGKHRCIWYDMIDENTTESGYCGYFFFRQNQMLFLCYPLSIVIKILKVKKLKKVIPGKTICPYRNPGMYNYSEPELI